MLLIAFQVLLRRLLLAAPIVLCVSALVFVILRLLPADPVSMSLPPGATEADYARLQAELGLDRSIPVQYLIWLGNFLAGNLGTSIFFRRPVADLVTTALPNTIELVAAGLILGVAAGVLGGLLMFAGRGSLAEQAADVGATTLMSIPEFLWALLLILGLGVALPLLPFVGRLSPELATPPAVTGFLLLDSLLSGRLETLGSALLHLVLPSVALAIGLAPLIMRVLRSSLLEAILDDHITQARLRGVPERTVLVRHALPNAALPTVSLIGVQAGFMFGGTVLVEVIFGYPGLGNLMVDAVRNHDLPVIQAVALVYCLLVLAINAVVDVLYLVINPKLRAA